MNRDETRALLALIASFDGRRRFQTPDIEAWSAVVADVPAEVGREAVLAHYATETDCVMPAQVRRFAAARAGLLAPDDDEAFRAAAAVASATGEGLSALPAAVQDAYWTLGGSHGFTANATSVRAQFRDAYTAARARHDRSVLLGRLDQLAVEA